MKNYYKNILITGATFILLLLATEIFFRLFMVQSEGTGVTLISKAWFERYWKPFNSLGYRDIEHTKDSLKGKKIIFVVGDSIVAGQGIKNYKDCFSNLLQDKLGENFEVINIAKCGWTTEDEYWAILNYPDKPDMIIVSYLPNDIEGATKKKFIYSPLYRKAKAIPVISYFLNNSYFFNYFFCRVLVNAGDQFRLRYLQSMKSSFLDKAIFEKHKESLLNIVNYAKNEHIKLLFIFPQFYKTIEECYFTYKIIEFLKLKKVITIDMTERIIQVDTDMKNYLVSAIDQHPNEKANRIFADTIFEYIKNSKVLEVISN